MTSGNWADRPLLAIDSETTGVDPFSARIVEVAAATMDPAGQIIDTWSRIVDPGVPIPAEAAEVHGIDNDRAAAEGISPLKALAELAVRLWDHVETFEGRAPVVMYNAAYDWPLILAEADRHHVEVPVLAPILDPYLIDRLMDRQRHGKRRLALVLAHYDIPISEVEAVCAHGALHDAIAAGHIMRQIIARYPELRERTLPGLWLRQVHGHEHDRRQYVDWVRCNHDARFDKPAGWPVPLERERSR